MAELLQFAVLGLGTGAVLTLLAQGIVVIFRGAGVVNLAHGAFAMLAGYLYLELTGHGWPRVLALPATVLLVALVGAGTDQLLLRRLRTASPLTRLIATLGMLLLVQSLTARIWGIVPKAVPRLLPSSAIRMGHTALPSDRFWLLGIALVATVVLTLLWQHTRLGWAAEAVADNQRLAASLGWSPELVSGVTWAVGAGLAAVAGILIAPLVQLDTTTLPLLIVPALAAALIGGFRSFPLTCAGALGIGIAQSLVSRYIHVTGAPDALPFLVIIVGLVVSGTALPLRGHAFDRLPRVGSGRVAWRTTVPVVLLAVLVVSQVSSPDWQSVISSSAAVSIVLLSFVVVVGYTGQISLAQFTLAGLGALVAAQTVARTGLPFPLAVLLGGVAASGVGVAFALSALRTRGVSLAVVTLGLALTAQSMIFSNSNLAGTTNGINLPSPTLFGWNINAGDHPARYSVFAFAVFVLLALGTAKLRRSSVGRTLLSIRDNERAAASNGVNVITGKLAGFAIGGFVAGVGGVVLAFRSQNVIFSAGYDPLNALTYLSYIVIGGVGFIGGAVFGSVFAPTSVGSVLSLHLTSFNDYLPLIGSLALLVTLALNPHGWAYEVIRPFARLRRTPAPTAVALPGSARQVEPVTLRVDGLTIAYGRTVAIDDVTLTVRPGEIVGLIGPNGAGKTSFMDGVTGFTPVRAGAVHLDDLDVSRWTPNRRVDAGLGRSFQSLELYPDLTVRENLQVAADRHDTRHFLASLVRGHDRAVPEAIAGFLTEVELDQVLDRLPEDLTYGQRRLLGLARAIAGHPSVLLVDEPASGLDEDETAELGVVLRSLAAERGMSILLVEHDMQLVMGICDRVVVIDFGRQIAAGLPEAVQSDPAALAAYLGEAGDDEGTRTDAPVVPAHTGGAHDALADAGAER